MLSVVMAVLISGVRCRVGGNPREVSSKSPLGHHGIPSGSVGAVGVDVHLFQSEWDRQPPALSSGLL